MKNINYIKHYYICLTDPFIPNVSYKAYNTAGYDEKDAVNNFLLYIRGLYDGLYDLDDVAIYIVEKNAKRNFDKKSIIHIRWTIRKSFKETKAFILFIFNALKFMLKN